MKSGLTMLSKNKDGWWFTNIDDVFVRNHQEWNHTSFETQDNLSLRVICLPSWMCQSSPSPKATAANAGSRHIPRQKLAGSLKEALKQAKAYLKEDIRKWWLPPTIPRKRTCYSIWGWTIGNIMSDNPMIETWIQPSFSPQAVRFVQKTFSKETDQIQKDFWVYHGALRWRKNVIVPKQALKSGLEPPLKATSFEKKNIVQTSSSINTLQIQGMVVVCRQQEMSFCPQYMAFSEPARHLWCRFSSISIHVIHMSTARASPMFPSCKRSLLLWLSSKEEAARKLVDRSCCSCISSPPMEKCDCDLHTLAELQQPKQQHRGKACPSQVMVINRS